MKRPRWTKLQLRQLDDMVRQQMSDDDIAHIMDKTRSSICNKRIERFGSRKGKKIPSKLVKKKPVAATPKPKLMSNSSSELATTQRVLKQLGYKLALVKIEV